LEFNQSEGKKSISNLMNFVCIGQISISISSTISDTSLMKIIADMKLQCYGANWQDFHILIVVCFIVGPSSLSL